MCAETVGSAICNLSHMSADSCVLLLSLNSDWQQTDKRVRSLNSMKLCPLHGKIFVIFILRGRLQEKKEECGGKEKGSWVQKAER